mmetsp:Transcript_19486/g.52463  ORF Transcript_19486/g.52463 Transcript_19486/m.52463 type:complete len:211 (-) Transcript_19486:486-1118(-)
MVARAHKGVVEAPFWHRPPYWQLGDCPGHLPLARHRRSAHHTQGWQRLRLRVGHGGERLLLPPGLCSPCRAELPGQAGGFPCRARGVRRGQGGCGAGSRGGEDVVVPGLVVRTPRGHQPHEPRHGGHELGRHGPVCCARYRRFCYAWNPFHNGLGHHARAPHLCACPRAHDRVDDHRSHEGHGDRGRRFAPLCQLGDEVEVQQALLLLPQ